MDCEKIRSGEDVNFLMGGGWRLEPSFSFSFPKKIWGWFLQFQLNCLKILNGA